MIKSYMGTVELRGPLPVLLADMTMIVRSMRIAYEERGLSEEEFLDDLADVGQNAMRDRDEIISEGDPEELEDVMAELLKGLGV